MIVDEGRKRVLMIVASILAARRLAQLEFKPCPAYEAVIGNAIVAAEKIMRRIDSHWPARKQDKDF